MRKTITIGSILLLLALAFYWNVHRPAATRSSQPIAYAPDFSLPQMNEQPLRLSSYRGKIVLLDFWATWCEPCQQETPRLIEFQNRYGSQGLQIIGVSMDDSAQPVREFVQRFRIDYPVVLGNADVGRAYGGVLGLPIMFLIDRNGRIRKKMVGATSASTIQQNIENLIAAD